MHTNEVRDQAYDYATQSHRKSDANLEELRTPQQILGELVHSTGYEDYAIKAQAVSAADRDYRIARHPLPRSVKAEIAQPVDLVAA